MREYFFKRKRKKEKVYGEAAARVRGSAGGGKPGRVAPGHPPPCAHPLPLTTAAATLAPSVRTTGPK